MLRLTTLCLTTSFFLAACGAETDEGDARLARYRAALPQKDNLTVGSPSGDDAARALGETALYPQFAHPIATGVNGAVTQIVDLMRAIVDAPPTLYNDETKEYFWGPYERDDDFGSWAAYIRENPEGDDFKYGYALLRGVGTDVSSLAPVIWGGATPDPDNEDFGAGVTLWDFEANHAFAEANDPDFAAKDFDRGRFVAVYAKNALPDDDGDGESDGTLALNLAAFGQFVPKDEPSNEPLDATYLYGHFSGGIDVRFLDFEAAFDVDEPADDISEDVSIRMAFFNRGAGRAEANVTGGSLDNDQSINAVECWDASIDQTFFDMTLTDGEETAPIASEGSLVEGCGTYLQHTLDQLNIPSIASVDAADLAMLHAVAAQGVGAVTE